MIGDDPHRPIDIISPSVDDANRKLKWGVGLGAFALASYAVFGTVCPICLVATPALLGAGLFERVRNHRACARLDKPSDTVQATSSNRTPQQ